MLLRHPHLPKSSRLFTLAYGLLPWPGRQGQYLPLPATSGSLSSFFFRGASPTHHCLTYIIGLLLQVLILGSICSLNLPLLAKLFFLLEMV